MNNDLISRKALREIVKTLFWSEIYKSTILQLIDNAPTVAPDKIQAIMSDYLVYRCEPQRPQGEWIKNEHTFWTCSHCNWFNEMNRIKYNFCPCCGAKMEGGAE